MAQVKGEIDEVKDLVSQTIGNDVCQAACITADESTDNMAEKVIDRNERIELIVDRSEELSRLPC